MLRRIVLFLVLAISAGVIAQAPDEETVLPVFQDKDSYLPAVAFGEGNFLVVWQAGRLAPGDLRSNLKDLLQSDLVAMRVTPSGTVLDSRPILANDAPGLQSQPQLAFGNGVFLLVWQDFRNGRDWDIYASRIDREGRVLDQQGIAVCTETGAQAFPRLAWDGNDFVIVWQDFRTGKYYEIYASRVSATGEVKDPGGKKLYSGVAQDRHLYLPAIADAGNGRSLIIWMVMTWAGAAGSSPSAQLSFFENGAVVSTIDIPYDRNNGPGRQACPAVLVHGGGTYLVAWRTDAPAGRGDAANGSNAFLADGQGNIIKRFFVDGTEKRIQQPEACWDGSQYVVAWQQTVYADVASRVKPYLVVQASRISPSGDILAVENFSGSLESPAAEPAVASDGAGTSLIAYEKHPASASDPIAIAFRIWKRQ
jgi:hypothetical protein